MDFGTWGCIHEPTTERNERSPSHASAGAAVWQFAKHTAGDCKHSGPNDRDSTGQPAGGLRAGIRSLDCVWGTRSRLPWLVSVSWTLLGRARNRVWPGIWGWLL